uniref:Putative nmda receptor-regulated protein 2 n=1 Tax=Ixodes ricinus TaxID=34613 RepID=A0A131Y1W5_IXORI
MSFPFSAWDYRHYSLLHAEEEAAYYNQFIQLMEKKCLGPLPAARGRPRGSPSGQSPEKGPRFSSLSRQEHLLYLRLLQMYQHRVVGEPTALEQEEIACLADLHKRVVEEQKEFAASFKDLPDVRESYGIIHPDALRFAKECLRRDLERLLHYPSHFEPHSELPLDRLNESLPRLLATPLQLGRCPVLKRPALDEDCSVEIDYGQLSRRFLCEDTKGAGVHPSIGPPSEDSMGFRLALEHRANVLLELETMVVLLNNHGPEFDSPWELPLCVKQDAESGHNVACLDAAIPSAAFSKRRKNQLCYDFATRICMTCSSSITSKVTPQAGQDAKEEPELIDDLFGPVKDMETFGVEPKIVPLSPPGGSEGAPQECSGAAPLSRGAIEGAHLDCFSAAPVPRGGNECAPPECSGAAPFSMGGSEGAPPEHSSAAPALKNILPDSAASPDRTEVKLMSPRLRSSSRSPTKRIPTTPRGSAESACSCSSRIVTRRAKQQCAYCSRRASESPIRSPTPSSDGLVIDDDLVIDEDEPPDEGVGPVAQDVAPAKRLEGVVPTEQSQTGGGDARPSGAEPMERVKPHSEMERLPTATDKNVPDEGTTSSALKTDQDRSEESSGQKASATDRVGSAQNAHAGTGVGGGDGVPPLPDSETVCYHLWEMGASRILLRVRVHAVAENGNDRWSVLPKLDYNAKYGAEAFTRAELVRQMAHLVFIPNSRLLRVRVDVRSSKVLLTEELGTGDLPTLSSSFRPDELFYRASYVLGRLSELGPGHYILDHKKDRATVQVLKTAEDKGSLDLHTVVQQRTIALNADCLAGPEEVLPLDPCVVLPVAFRGNQIPATFPVKHRATKKAKRLAASTGETSSPPET